MASPRTTCTASSAPRESRQPPSLSSERSVRGWRDNHAHTDGDQRLAVKEPPYPPPGMNAAPDGHQERRTLNMNRVTWRNLLCMNDSAPSHDEESVVNFPLDHNQMTNIISTIEGMMAQERLLFMCSLVRFVLEMMHQISIAMATDAQPPPHDDPPEDDDNVMMMQTNGLLLASARMKFNAVHHDLEKIAAHRRQRARALLHAIEQTWGPHLHQAISTDIQGLLAVLTVHAHESADDAGEPVTTNDDIWARRWLEDLRLVINDVLRLPAPAVNDSIVEVQESVTSGQSSCGVALTSNSQITLERERAAALQDEENATLQHAMSSGTKRVKRTQVDIVIQTGASTTRTRLHVPELTPNSSLQLQLGISTVLMDIPEDTDTSALMQTNIGAPCPLLRLLTPHARRRVLQRVLRDLRVLIGRKLRECITLLREQHEISQILGETPVTEDGTTTNDTAEHTFVADIADLHIQHLQALMEHCFNPPCEVDVDDILHQMMGLQGQVDRSTQRPHARHDELARQRCLGTETQTHKIANRILDDVQEYLYQYEGTDRADLLRDMVATLINEVQTTAAKQLTLLHLVGHYLPQPYAMSETSSTTRMQGRSYAREIIDTINQPFAVDAPLVLGNGPFGVSDILNLIPTLSCAATQSMIFLEDGQYDLEDITTPTDIPEGDTQTYEDPALINAPSGLCRRDDVAAMEEDAVRRAIQASRQIDRAHQDEDEHVGTTTMVGGATSSTSRLLNSTTTPTRTMTTPTRTTAPAPRTTSTPTAKRRSKPIGEGKHAPAPVRKEPIPEGDETGKTKGTKVKENKQPESKRQRRSGDMAKGSSSIRKYLGDT